MIKPFLKEISNPVEIPASDVWYIEYNGVKLSEGLPAQFVPIVSVAALNNSSDNIKVFVNETEDNAYRVPSDASRAIAGIPIWDVAVRNMSAASAINAGEVVITLINDMEQVSRYNAFSKNRGF